MPAHGLRSFPRKRESSPEGKASNAASASTETRGAKTVTAEIERWLTHLGAERRYSPKTLEAYRRDITQFLGFLTDHLGGRPSLKDLTALTPADVQTRPSLTKIAFGSTRMVGKPSASLGQ